MDIGIILGLAMLIVWGVATFVYEAPGWIHLLLTAGVFLIIWRIVVRGTPGADEQRPASKPNDSGKPKSR
jgi:uncharacterized membrane protein